MVEFIHSISPGGLFLGQIHTIMKYLISFFTLFIALHLSGQTGIHSAQNLTKKFAYYCAGQEWKQFLDPGIRSAITQKLDSVVTFDASSSVTQKIAMDYNSNHNTVHLKQFGPDSLTSVIELQGVFTMEYTEPDYPWHIIAEALNNTTHQLDKQLEFNIFYGNMHRLDSMVISLADPFSGIFEPTLATKEVYSGNLLTQSREWFYFSLFGFWVPSSKTDYQYDGTDRLIDQLTSVIDFQTQEVTPSTRTTYHYNASSKQDTVTNYSWNGMSWDRTDRTVYNYFSSGTKSSELAQNFINGSWVNNTWTKYAIENVNDKYPTTGYYWDDTNSTWNKSDSTVNLLNPALPWGQVAAPRELAVLSASDYFSGPSFVADESSILETRYFLADSLSQQLFYDSKDVYHYSDINSSAVKTVLPEYISVTPNPAHDQFTINIDQDRKAIYTVYSASGEIIDSGEITSGDHNIKISVPGIYLVKFQLPDGNVFIHKQIIE